MTFCAESSAEEWSGWGSPFRSQFGTLALPSSCPPPLDYCGQNMLLVDLEALALMQGVFQHWCETQQVS